MFAFSCRSTGQNLFSYTTKYITSATWRRRHFGCWGLEYWSSGCWGLEWNLPEAWSPRISSIARAATSLFRESYLELRSERARQSGCELNFHICGVVSGGGATSVAVVVVVGGGAVSLWVPESGVPDSGVGLDGGSVVAVSAGSGIDTVSTGAGGVISAGVVVAT